MSAVSVWDPCAALASRAFVLLVLNRSVEEPALLARLWNRAAYRVTVDGGTTVWQSILNNVGVAVQNPVPDLICGDLDSADMDTVEHFRQLGACVVQTPDQDHTDFTKALMELGRVAGEDQRVGEAQAVLAFVETGGRMDHVMGNLQSLALAPGLAPALPPHLLLCSSHSLSWLLPPGRHTVIVPHPAPLHCGLVPLDGRAVVTTTGLTWNLAAQELRFGDLVSTSNSFAGGAAEVSVTTDSLLLWTMDLPDIPE
jgi:thiamine pyrophosphokinase